MGRRPTARMDYATYASPFSWRYGRAELRSLFSEEERRRLWRAVWVALAEAQRAQGLVSRPKRSPTLRAHADEIDIEAALAIEREIHHDLMAEIRVFASQATDRRRQAAPRRDLDGHRGYGRNLPAAARARARSARTCGALLARVRARRFAQYADLVCMAFTHLQPAEPTTLGYRLAVVRARPADRRRAICASSSRTSRPRACAARSARRRRTSSLLRSAGRSAEIEAHVLERFGLQAREISTQTYPRKLDYLLLSALAGLGASLSKFAADVRILSSPRLRRSCRAVRQVASRQLGDAVQAQSDHVRAHRLARASAAGYADVAWQNAATNLSRAHARRQREPPHDSSRSAAVRRRDRHARAHAWSTGLRVDERRIAQNLAHVRAVRRHRSGDDGSGPRRRRPSGAARSRFAMRRWKRGTRSRAAKTIRSRDCLTEERAADRARRSGRDPARCSIPSRPRRRRAPQRARAARRPHRRSLPPFPQRQPSRLDGY